MDINSVNKALCMSIYFTDEKSMTDDNIMMQYTIWMDFLAQRVGTGFLITEL